MTKKMKKVKKSIQKNADKLKQGQVIKTESNPSIAKPDPKKNAQVKAAMKQAIKEKAQTDAIVKKQIDEANRVAKQVEGKSKKHHKKHHHKKHEEPEDDDDVLLEDNVGKSLAKRKELDEKKKSASFIAQLGSTLSGTMHYILGASHTDN